MNYLSIIGFSTILTLSSLAVAQEDPIINCFLQTAASSSLDTTIKDIAKQCDKQGGNFPVRLIKEKLTENNDFVITPHKQNYLLPFTHNAKPNQQPFSAQNIYPDIDTPIQHKEAKLQISFKVPLIHQDIFTEKDGLYFGFTLKSFWQVYNHKLSAPFRETNYQPELFYQAPIHSNYLGGTWFTRLGFEHESNGQTQLFSRSWNRAYFGIGFQKDNWAIYLQPWYRIPEKTKLDDNNPDTPPPPRGDDNPDISDYMGYYDLISVIDYGKIELTNNIRFNFNTGHGSLETGVSFPLWGRLKGYFQFYQGYGESLIDYNHKIQRVGIGLLLTELI